MPPEPFPSLVIGADSLDPQGAFARAQADYLQPDEDTVAELTALLRARNAGVVAHFYMDPELQGVLSASNWPHIQISDSLLMADAAVKMAQQGVDTVIVLGVDFMSENVRAMLDASGLQDVQCYRVAAEPIGCSLAESAESRAYAAYLQQASRTPDSLHVIYINTSLRTKAHAQHTLPTITCTSSNVVKTILQADTQVQGLHVWFGPDTYMGRNLAALFEALASMDDATVAAVHPGHTTKSVADLLERFHYFEQGTCIVHHMFGSEVARRVQDEYGHAFVTAHLEVPGEMFALGLVAQQQGRGVVGSTSNILQFITDKVRQAADANRGERLSFVLGTESGMITSIVRGVQAELAQHRVPGLEAEIIFPVASEAITPTQSKGDLAVVPGAAAGEGCSVEGGCATCPYMKMNSLDGLFDVLQQTGKNLPGLVAFRPRTYEEVIEGKTLAELGGQAILNMRDFQRAGTLSDSLVSDIVTRNRETGT